MHLWEFHPALVHLPIGLLVGAVLLDLASMFRPREMMTRTAAGLYIGGLAAAVPAAASGALAWYTAPHSGEVHELMFWHPALAVAGVGLFAVVAFFRWRTRALPPTGSQALLIIA